MRADPSAWDLLSNCGRSAAGDFIRNLHRYTEIGSGVGGVYNDTTDNGSLDCEAGVELVPEDAGEEPLLVHAGHPQLPQPGQGGLVLRAGHAEHVLGEEIGSIISLGLIL